MGLPKTFLKGFHNEDSVQRMVYKQLGKSDLVVSKVSLGGGAFSGFYGDFNDTEGIATVEEAFKLGVNYIDTAPYYGEGRSETLLGKALKNIPREVYYISTKVGRYTSKWETMFDYSKDTIISRFERSLQRLGLTYVDIAIVHDVEFADKNQVLNEALPALKQLVEQGKVRYIAISGYPVATLWEVIQESKINIDIVLSYSRETLIDTTLSKFAQRFRDKGLGIINAAPTAMQMLTNKGPEAWHPASKEIKQLCAEAIQYCKENNVELGTLAVYHAMHSDIYDTCLVGFNTREVMHFNLNLIFKGLSSKEETVLKELKEKFFTLKEDLHWEGVEIAVYKKHMESFNV